MKAKYTDGLLWDDRYDNDSTEMRVFVPEESDVETAAEGMYLRDNERLSPWITNPTPWGELRELDRDTYRQIARDVLDSLGWFV